MRYPPSQSGGQGVGAHKDSLSLFTFLSQDQVGGLQVLNKSGEWIDATPIVGSLVVNIAQGFEAATGGLCSATTHRVEVLIVSVSNLTLTLFCNNNNHLGIVSNQHHTVQHTVLSSY